MGTNKRAFTVLVIDGGGVRGIIPARVMAELEERTGKPMAELFDMVAVTSVGSLMGSALTAPSDEDPKKPRFTAKEIAERFGDDVQSIFPEVKFRNLKHFVPGTDGYYDVKKLEEKLSDIYGDKTIGDSLTNLIITATDVKSNRPVWIEKLDKISDKEGWRNMALKDAVRASCTAPTMFKTKYFYTSPNPEAPDAQERYVFLDGGVFGSTLPRNAYTKAKQIAPAGTEIVMVHLGTLYKNNNYSPENFNNASPLDLMQETAGMMIHMTLQATLEDLESEMGDRLISFDGKMDHYEPELKIEKRIDAASTANIEALGKYADRMIIDEGEKLDKLAEILKNKVYADQEHTRSKNALRTLARLLDKQVKQKDFNIMYTKIVEYNGDIEHDNLNKEDKKLYCLARELNCSDQAKLERIFIALNEKKKYQNQKPQKFMRSIKSMFTFWGNKDDNANDNKKQSKQVKKNNRSPKN